MQTTTLPTPIPARANKSLPEPVPPLPVEQVCAVRARSPALLLLLFPRQLSRAGGMRRHEVAGIYNGQQQQQQTSEAILSGSNLVRAPPSRGQVEPPTWRSVGRCGARRKRRRRRGNWCARAAQNGRARGAVVEERNASTVSPRQMEEPRAQRRSPSRNSKAKSRSKSQVCLLCANGKGEGEGDPTGLCHVQEANRANATTTSAGHFSPLWRFLFASFNCEHPRF